jgi:tetratricopeptide (TPR) repeat protein
VQLDAARAFVPSWVYPQAVLVHAAVAGAIACAVGASLHLLGRKAIARRAPWPVRARSLFVCRRALDMAFLVFLLPLAVHAPSQRLLAGLPAGAAMAASALALAFWRHRLTRAIVGEDHTLRRAVIAVAARTAILHPQLWTILPLAIAMPWRADLAAALFVVAITALLLAMPFARPLAPPAPPEIAHDVMEAAARKGIRLRGVCQIDLPEAEVYALPFAQRIAFTKAALWKIDRPALLALAQLEVLRMRDRRSTIFAAALFALAPVLAARISDLPMAAAVVIAIALAHAFQLRPQPFDGRHDPEAFGAEPAPGAYARALAETQRLNLVPAVLRRATFQPDLHDRLAATGAPLPYARPRPPSQIHFAALMALVAVAAVATAVWGPLAATYVAPRSWNAAVLCGQDAWFAAPLGDLARARHGERRYEEAAKLYEAAAVLDPKGKWLAYQSMSLAAAGRIEDAERALAEAVERGADKGLVAEARGRIDRRR